MDIHALEQRVFDDNQLHECANEADFISKVDALVDGLYDGAPEGVSLTRNAYRVTVLSLMSNFSVPLKSIEGKMKNFDYFGNNLA